jgi:cytochrome c553
MRRFVLVGALLLAPLSMPAHANAAGDPAEGRKLATQCQVCHGMDGIGTNPTVPNIGGESEMYLTKQLQDFREGRRVNEQMSIMAEGLTDEQIAHLAAWYGSIEFSVTIPE